MRRKAYDAHWSPGERKPPIEPSSLEDETSAPYLLQEKIERLERLQGDAPDDPIIAQELAKTRAKYEKIYGTGTADQTTDNSNP